jgi:predicted oxidoreductase
MSRKTGIVVSILVLLSGTHLASSQSEPDPDAIIIGTGIAGLSAALELGRGGAQVQVVDMWSVFGGHAVMSTGGLAIVGSETQRRMNVVDTPEIAKQDFFEWGEDPDPYWVDFYVEKSNEMIGEWLAELGVTWSGAIRIPGNSVPRFHLTDGRGLGLAGPVYRETLKHSNIVYRWNFKVTELLLKEGRIVGIRGEDMRTGAESTLNASNVVVATGGFQSNLEMVFDNWPEHLPKAETMLIASGLNSVGSGHELVREVGGSFHRMDHQWNYGTGMPHPHYPGEGRALSTSVNDSIWVNSQAERFVNESGSVKEQFPAVVKQEPATYWAIFDEDGKYSAGASGSGWQDFEVIQAEILDNDDLTIEAESIQALAKEIGLDPERLEQTVQRVNAMIERGVDEDFGRFDSSDELPADAAISQPPFYAIQMYPMTRKSMGGILIDLGGRVVNEDGRAIDGLYAAGEATGMAGINGWAGLEGTFLGPSLVTGRVAGQTILAEVARSRELVPSSPRELTSEAGSSAPPATAEIACEQCHNISSLLAQQRSGYDHFQRVHERVQERNFDCAACHADMQPYNPLSHRTDRFAQVDICQRCHLAVEYAE